MCGIVAAVGHKNIVGVLLEGLRKLEYRGYDSAGVAVLNGNGLVRVRSAGRVADLTAETEKQHLSGETGIAHTRWATHGAPCERNAHPHISNGLAVVHNGIIENHEALRTELKAAGYEFTSDTDTEVIAHLVHQNLATAPDLVSAVRAACTRLVGAYAIGVIQQDNPYTTIVAREGSPLVLGLADDANYAASDTAALLQVTRRMVYLENGDVAVLTPERVDITRQDGTPVWREEVESLLSADAVELGPYEHYMQKEIFEQPGAIINTLDMLGGTQTVQAGWFGAKAEEIFKDIDRILILACGTSYHAGLTARYWLEGLAKLPTSVEVASEYRYRDSVPDPRTLVIAISQSGETADTLAALKHAQDLGMPHALAICNVPESAIIRACPLRFLTHAGPEIGVASTKAFTTQLAALYVLTLVLAKVKGSVSQEYLASLVSDLRHLPAAITSVLELEPQIKDWAHRFADKHHALFLGRGVHYPIALEGALKLKEITYIHAEAYAAGELKHGPLALVDKDMPVISVAPNNQLLEKLKSNLQEVKARGGELFVLADANTGFKSEDGVHVISVPDHAGSLSPIVHTVPLQLLSYHTALAKGTDVDKPRNLAKSVTVE
jgi:glucosamine--fructose-6-phosphate aminotransferase (isomerizing)